MTNDMEINMLRHQVLDLQSTGDNKAIIARQVTLTYRTLSIVL